MNTLTPRELADWLADDSRPAPQLLDVREPWEHQICRLPGAQLVPMREVPQRADELEPDRPVVCICHHGARSAQVALFLERHGLTTYNLTGGLDAWARQVEPAMPTY